MSQQPEFKASTCETCKRADRGCHVTPRQFNNDNAACNWIPADWFAALQAKDAEIQQLKTQRCPSCGWWRSFNMNDEPVKGIIEHKDAENAALTEKLAALNTERRNVIASVENASKDVVKYSNDERFGIRIALKILIKGDDTG